MSLVKIREELQLVADTLSGPMRPYLNPSAILALEAKERELAAIIYGPSYMMLSVQSIMLSNVYTMSYEKLEYSRDVLNEAIQCEEVRSDAWLDLHLMLSRIQSQLDSAV